MSKLTLTNITSGYATNTAINANNTAIVNALENTLSRDGTTPNTMAVDLDMNNHSILNASGLVLNGVSVVPTGTTTVNSNGMVYQPVGTGTVATTVQSKLNTLVSVVDYGADITGVADATSAFSNASKNAPANAYRLNTSIARAVSCDVYVNAGTYNLITLVDVGNRDVTWWLDEGVVIPNSQYLQGRVVRGQQYMAGNHYGIENTATGHFVKAGGGANADASPVTGLTTPAGLANYANRDSVGSMIYNIAPDLLTTCSAASYTATTLLPNIPLTAIQMSKLRIGMIIDTNHATKYSGFITGWAGDGTSVTVSNWYLSGGGAGTPANGVDAYINPFTKIWAHNGNVTLTPTGFAKSANGYEMDLVNNSGVDSDAAYNTSGTAQTWGFTVASYGTNHTTAGYTSQGKINSSFVSDQSINGIGFKTVGQETIGFQYQNTTGTASIAFQALFAGNTTVNINTFGQMELGRIDVAQITNIDFHSSGNNIDYDSRIYATGGSGSVGQGSLVFVAETGCSFNSPIVSNNIFASVDNTYSLGLSTNRYTSVWTGVLDLSTASSSATSGHVKLGNSTQTTIGANGAASALTPNPLGYLIAYLGTTKIILPYYNA